MKHLPIKLTILLLITQLFINPSFALTDDQASQQQLIIQQQQEQQRQQEANQQKIDEAERIRKTRTGIDGGADDGSSLFGTDESSVNKDGTCKYEFKLIVLNGRNVIARKTLKKDVLGKYLKRCINKSNIKSIQEDLMKYYIDNGYTNARIYFDFAKNNYGDIKNGVFNIVIEEGKVRNIELNDVRYNNKLNEKIEKAKQDQVNQENKTSKENENNKNKSETEISETEISKIKESSLHKFRNNMQKFFAFPLLESKEFNLRDYEQGLDQINRLNSNNATMDIRAVDDDLSGTFETINNNIHNNNNDKNSNNKDNNNNITSQNNNSQTQNSSLAVFKPKTLKDAGYSDIIITNNNSFPISLNIGAENSGNSSTGERNGYIGTNIDNLLSINDNIYLKYTQDLDWENSKRYNKAFYGSLSVPLGYWTFNTSVNYSKYLTTVNGYYTTFHTHGDTLTHTYGIDRVMYRRQLYKINAGTELTLRDTENWVRDLKSETGSRRSTNMNFYINNIIYTKFGTIIIKPSYQKGLSWFNAKKDGNDLLRTESRNQYDLVKLYAYYNTKVNLPLFTKSEVKNKDGTNMMQSVPQKDKDGNIIKDNKGNPQFELQTDKDGNPIKDKNNTPVAKQEPITVRNKLPINYTLTFNTQHSWNTLYGTDQFSVGGEWTVRGFKENTISGDNGYNIRNDLRVNLLDLFPNCIINTEPMKFGNTIKGKQYNLSMNDALSRTYLSLFYDYGFVTDKYGDSSDTEYNSKHGYMAGTGLALNYYGKYLDWSLTYAKALHSPNYLENRDAQKKENQSVYWRMVVKF